MVLTLLMNLKPWLSHCPLSTGGWNQTSWMFLWLSPSHFSSQSEASWEKGMFIWEEQRADPRVQPDLISYSLRLARPCDMRGERNPPKRAAMKAVKMRGKVKTASPCLSSEKTAILQLWESQPHKGGGGCSYLRRGPWGRMVGCRCSQGSKGRPGLTRPRRCYSCCNRQRSEAGVGSQRWGESRGETRQTLSYLAEF